MTGYGEAEREIGPGRLRVEIRTVNHRFLHVTARGPAGFDRLSSALEGWLRDQLSRGHAQVNVTFERDGREQRAPLEVDLERARAYQEGLARLREELGVAGTVDLALLAGFRDLFRPVEEPEGFAIDPDLLREVALEACRGVVRMREQEGERLRLDLAARLDAMRARIEEIRERAPGRLAEERDRLRAAVRELAEGLAVDEERLAREVAHLAERWDISEEIVRFAAHVDAFRETLEEDSATAVGKRLGFLTQELLREANTIGSKANDTQIAHAVVAVKEEIERLREQVENVE